MTRPGAFSVGLVLPLLLALSACGGGGSGSPAAPSSPSPTASLGTVDAALVGNWTGTIDGSLGAGTLAMTLSSDASMETLGSGGYCRLVGQWGVSGGRFTGRGTECAGFTVTFTAPATASRLDGTWTASGGASGQFAVTK